MISPKDRQCAKAVVRAAQLYRLKGDLESGGRRSGVAELGELSGLGRVPQHRDSSHRSDRFFDYRQPLAAQLRREDAHAGHVPAGACEVRDEPGADWIGGDEHDDRSCRRGLLERQNRRLANTADDDIRVGRDEFSGGPRITLGTLDGIPTLEHDVLVLDPAVVAESADKCLPDHSELRVIYQWRGEYTDLRDVARPLRSCGERRGEHGSQASHERAAVHRFGSHGWRDGIAASTIGISSFATADRHGERERRALPNLALDPDLAAVKFDELA